MLSREQQEQFAANGFVTIDPQIDDSIIDEVVNRIGRELYGSDSDRVIRRDPARPGSGRVQDAWTFDAGVKQIILAPVVLAGLAKLYGRAARPFQTLNFRLGTEQMPHSDTVHFNCTPSGFMCGVWLALEDIDESNGAVAYYPGSHTLPEFNFTQVLAEPDLAARLVGARRARWSPGALMRRLKGKPPKFDVENNYGLYEEFIQRQIAKFGLRPALATIKKGQAFVWAANLLHGGSPQLDPGRTRHSQVSHYYFEGCGYHRPLLNVDGKIRYFEPKWVV